MIDNNLQQMVLQGLHPFRPLSSAFATELSLNKSAVRKSIFESEHDLRNVKWETLWQNKRFSMNVVSASVFTTKKVKRQNVRHTMQSFTLR